MVYFTNINEIIFIDSFSKPDIDNGTQVPQFMLLLYMSTVRRNYQYKSQSNRRSNSNSGIIKYYP